MRKHTIPVLSVVVLFASLLSPADVHSFPLSPPFSPQAYATVMYDNYLPELSTIHAITRVNGNVRRIRPFSSNEDNVKISAAVAVILLGVTAARGSG